MCSLHVRATLLGYKQVLAILWAVVVESTRKLCFTFGPTRSTWSIT